MVRSAVKAGDTAPALLHQETFHQVPLYRVMVPKASMVRLAVKAGTQAKRVM
jgi:hypothetical protein